MKASRVTVSTFGAIIGIAGIEHGIGEILQENKVPEGFYIESWPDNPLYEILSGEPALTVIPNLFLTGILAIIASIALIIWVIFFIERKHGALIFLLLTFIGMLVGIGVAGPILIGIITGLAATRINSQITWMNEHSSASDFLSKIWKYVYIVSIFSWFSLWPGLIILGIFISVIDPLIVISLTLLSFVSFILAFVSSFAYDSITIQ
ncbi:MAG: hypothetical protein ACFFFH_18185 [Candidatus Thorarchaeota archaeon]